MPDAVETEAPVAAKALRGPGGARPTEGGLRLGVAVWLGAWWLLRLSWAESTLVFSTLVLTPLALRALVETETDEGLKAWRAGYWRVAVGLQIPAGLALVASYLVNEGPWAALLALPWAAESLVLTRLGAARAWSRRFRGPPGELAIDGGLMLQIVGGGWIVAHRWGANPYGFDDGLVLLSALHTHLAALVLPVLLGLAARRGSDWLTGLTAALVLAGFPAVALAILVYPPLEGPAAWVLSAGALLTAWLQTQAMHVPGVSEPGARVVLIGCSSLCLMAGAALAALFALLPEVGVWWLDRSTMLVWHGGLMAVGFGGLGLLGWAWSWRRRVGG